MAAVARGSRRERWLAVGLLAALGFSAGGCTLLYRAHMALKRDYLLVDPLDKKGPRDRFFEWQGKAKPGGQALGIAIAPIVLRQPFSFEAQIGVFDPAELAGSDSALGCIEIDQEDLFGSVFFFVCLQYLSGTTPGVEVYTSLDNTNRQFYPGTYAGTTRMRSDATTLYFEFQPKGAVSFDSIETTPFANPTLGYNPSLGARIQLKGGVIDFQDARWTSTPKPSPTPEDQIAEGFENALSRLNEGCLSIDGGSPDFGGASTEVNNAFGYITTTRSLLPGLIDPKLQHRVGAKLDCMDKNALKALNAIGDLSVDGAVKRFERSMRCGAEGLATLRNFKPGF